MKKILKESLIVNVKSVCVCVCVNFVLFHFLKIEELGAQGMVDEAQAMMAQVEALEKEKNSYGARTGSRVSMFFPFCRQVAFQLLYKQKFW